MDSIRTKTRNPTAVPERDVTGLTGKVGRSCGNPISDYQPGRTKNRPVLLLNGGVGTSATALLTIRSHRTATRGDTGSFPPANSVSSAAKALNAQAPESCPDKAKAPISPPLA